MPRVRSRPSHSISSGMKSSLFSVQGKTWRIQTWWLIHSLAETPQRRDRTSMNATNVINCISIGSSVGKLWVYTDHLVYETIAVQVSTGFILSSWWWRWQQSIDCYRCSKYCAARYGKRPLQIYDVNTCDNTKTTTMMLVVAREVRRERAAPPKFQRLRYRQFWDEVSEYLICLRGCLYWW